MEDLQRIDISANPEFPGVVRKAVVIGKNDDFLNKTVSLICRLEHYASDGVTRMNSFKPLERDLFVLTATNDSYVDPTTGALVTRDSATNQLPAGAVPQFDFLKDAVEAGANPFELSEAAIKDADKRKRFSER